MAFTEFCCRSGGNNLNAGTLDGSAEPAVTPFASFANGTWNGAAGAFTCNGAPDLSTLSVGQFVSCSLDADANPTSGQFFIGRISAIDNVGKVITVTSRTNLGTAMADGSGRTLRVGGAWAGPAGANAFPISFLPTTTNAAGDRPRINFKNNQTYSISAQMSYAGSAGSQLKITLQGYSATFGDFGRATIDGGSSGVAYTLLLINWSIWVIADFIFKNNGASSSADLVQVQTANGNHGEFIRCVFANSRGNGLKILASGIIVTECEAYGCNQSNGGNSAGFSAGSASTFVRCIAHDNSGSNTHGFYTDGGGDVYDGCIADTNGSVGFRFNANTAASYKNCEAYNNASHGFFVGNNDRPTYMENCNALKNGGAGVNGTGSSNNGLIANCGFGSGSMANTGGQTASIGSTVVIGSVTYASGVTPWIDPDNGDFRINLAAAKNAGRGAFTQTQAGYAGAIAYPDIGAAQHNDVPNPPPAVPVLSVADSQDGSHAVATVAGSTAGSTNQISVQLDGQSTWTAAGSRVGDGTVSLTLAKGYYWAKCDSTLNSQSSASNIVRLTITDANDSVHGRSANAIVAGIQALNLPNCKGVYRQMLPDENVIQVPCVIVYFNDGEQILGGTNARDDIGYPVVVAIVDRKLDNLGVMPDWVISWRQRIMRKFRNQPLATVPEIYTVTPVPAKVIDENLPKYLWFVSAFSLVCVSREGRG